MEIINEALMIITNVVKTLSAISEALPSQQEQEVVLPPPAQTFTTVQRSDEVSISACSEEQKLSETLKESIDALKIVVDKMAKAIGG